MTQGITECNILWITVLKLEIKEEELPIFDKNLGNNLSWPQSVVEFEFYRRLAEALEAKWFFAISIEKFNVRQSEYFPKQKTVKFFITLIQRKPFIGLF